MKKMSRNDLAGNIVRIEYGKVCHLLGYETPSGYNQGIYGWNYDIYQFSDITIIAGVRSLTGVKINDNIIKTYEDKARIIARDYSLTAEIKRAKTESLLYQCLNEIYKKYFMEV